MKIFVGADHHGHYLRQQLVAYLRSLGCDVSDESQTTLDPEDDYPLVAKKLINDQLAANDRDTRGILLCGSGQGVCIAANRHKGIRAALGYDQESVRSARHDDDANVLCLPAKSLSQDEVFKLTDTFLNTAFEPLSRYKRRIQELDQLP